MQAYDVNDYSIEAGKNQGVISWLERKVDYIGNVAQKSTYIIVQYANELQK